MSCPKMTTTGKLFYFCYASNLWSKRFNINVKSGEKYGNGLLRDWKLTFSGTSNLWKGASANIVPIKHSIVWGTIWAINELDFEQLGKQEVGYQLIEVDVAVNGSDQVVSCKVYVQTKEYSATGSITPSLAYKKVIINGAIEQQLPEDYIELIKAFADDGNLDAGPKDLIL